MRLPLACKLASSIWPATLQAPL